MNKILNLQTLTNWDKKDNRKVCKIMIQHDIDPMDENNWDELVKTMLDDSEKLYAVFKHRIDEFNRN